MNEKKIDSIIFEEEEEEVETIENDANNSQNEINILRTKIHNISELLKKSQAENKNLKKKNKELYEIVKKNGDKTKNDDKTKKISNNNKDLLKWKSIWEKVVTQMTEIIPFTLPKETNPDQQRKILLQLTNQLCQIAKNSTETAEYQNLKNKYERNKKKLIKLKEQCNSLLDLIQLRKNQTNYVNVNRFINYANDFDEILYDDDEYEINNHNKQKKYRFGFKTIHDDIILNNFSNDKGDSPLIQEQYNKNQSVNKKESKSKKSKLIEKNNNIEQSEYSSSKKSISKIQNKSKDTNSHSENENKRDEFSDSSKKGSHKFESNQNMNVLKTPTKADLAFSNFVTIDVKLNSESENSSKDYSVLHQENLDKTILKDKKDIVQAHSYRLTKDSKEASKIENQNSDNHVEQIDSNLNEIDKILDQEISEDEAEEVLNELESMKLSSNNDNEAAEKHNSKSHKISHHHQSKENYNSTQYMQNSNESKKISKKDFLNYRIKYGKNMNELIDITNKLRDQYYQVTKKYGHAERTKVNDIVRIEDPILNH